MRLVDDELASECSVYEWGQAFRVCQGYVLVLSRSCWWGHVLVGHLQDSFCLLTMENTSLVSSSSRLFAACLYTMENTSLESSLSRLFAALKQSFCLLRVLRIHLIHCIHSSHPLHTHLIQCIHSSHPMHTLISSVAYTHLIWCIHSSHSTHTLISCTTYIHLIHSIHSSHPLHTLISSAAYTHHTHILFFVLFQKCFEHSWFGTNALCDLWDGLFVRLMKAIIASLDSYCSAAYQIAQCDLRIEWVVRCSNIIENYLL